MLEMMKTIKKGRQVSPDLPDVVEGESTQPGDCSNVGREEELVIHGNPEVPGRG